MVVTRPAAPEPPAEARRGLPAIGRLLQQWPAPVPSNAAEALRVVLARHRPAIAAGATPPAPGCLLAEAIAWQAEQARPGLRPVINATGIVLHTNLGRAPLAASALQAVMATAGGYTNLEMDLQTGGRGGRMAFVAPLICALTGAAAALAVNNGAAAMLLALAALADGGEVVVSRGELVEIGGGFRIPDIIVQGGGRLVEVGTTNRTRLADFRAAIGPASRLLLAVHPSNYRMVGFTEAVGLGALARLAHEHGLLLLHDLGSGAFAPLGTPGEPTPRDSIAAGADLVAFSGDKLTGGPQAGLLAGGAGPIARLAAHPLMRALRLDKMTLAALEATLRLHLEGGAAVPAIAMLRQTPPVLASRAERLAGLLPDGAGRVAPSEGFAGGGTLPGQPIASRAVVITVADAASLARRLRLQRPAVIGRIAGGALWLDMLAVRDDEVEPLAASLRAALAEGAETGP